MLTLMLLFATALSTDEQAIVRKHIAKDTPALVEVERLTFEKRTIAVTGKASSPNAIADFVENIKNDPLFTLPVLKSLTKVGDSYEFELTTEVKAHGDECH